MALDISLTGTLVDIGVAAFDTQADQGDHVILGVVDVGHVPLQFMRRFDFATGQAPTLD